MSSHDEAQDRPTAGDSPPAILLEFGHGLGDAVQLTSVLQHVRHYWPTTPVDVLTLAGKDSACRGLCRQVYVRDRDAVPRGTYARVWRWDWPECRTAYRDWPSTKATRCLVEELRLTPRLALCRYQLECRPENLPVLKKNIGGFATIIPAALTYDPDVALLNAVFPNCRTTGGSAVPPDSCFSRIIHRRDTEDTEKPNQDQEL